MTATNHMMTGALIAAAIDRPVIAVPLAFLSHFATDILPHYGYGEVPFHELDSQKNFILKQALDIYFAMGMVWLIPYLLRNIQAPIVTMVCMLIAFAPDVVWTYQYVMAKRSGNYMTGNAFTQFHKKIQWCEKPWGIYVEIVWFLMVIGLMYLLAR